MPGPIVEGPPVKYIMRAPWLLLAIYRAVRVKKDTVWNNEPPSETPPLTVQILRIVVVSCLARLATDLCGFAPMHLQLRTQSLQAGGRTFERMLNFARI